MHSGGSTGECPGRRPRRRVAGAAALPGKDRWCRTGERGAAPKAGCDVVETATAPPNTQNEPLAMCIAMRDISLLPTTLLRFRCGFSSTNLMNRFFFFHFPLRARPLSSLHLPLSMETVGRARRGAAAPAEGRCAGGHEGARLVPNQPWVPGFCRGAPGAGCPVRDRNRIACLQLSGGSPGQGPRRCSTCRPTGEDRSRAGGGRGARVMLGCRVVRPALQRGRGAATSAAHEVPLRRPSRTQAVHSALCALTVCPSLTFVFCVPRQPG